MSDASRHTRAVLAALPFSAAVALFGARFLPVHFGYVENDLGIVSRGTLERYPQQQEMFWLLAAVACAALVTWALARWLVDRAPRGAAGLVVEGLGVLSLLGALWLPPVAGLCVAALCVVALPFFARGDAASLSAATDSADAPANATITPAPARGIAGLVAAALLLALLLNGDFWANAWSVAHDFSDEARAMQSFPFMGEIGQHLAWANALRNGEFPGKDFFCLYGPLYDLGLVGTWEMFGRSIVAWDLYLSATRVVALTGLLVLAGLLVDRRALVLLVPLLVPWISLRSGWAFIGLCFVLGWLWRRHWGLAAGAGIVAGVSLLFSQEFGLAFTLVAGLAFALHLAWRPAACFGVGAALVILPVFGWYAAHDALLPMLREIVGYPAYVVAGYAKLPFPALASQLPIEFSDWGTRELLAHQIGYGVPAICVGAALLALPISKLDWRAPRASIARACAALRADPTRTAVLLLAVFGMLAFRTALGRSDLKHLLDPLPAAAVLLVVAADRLLAGWRSARIAPSVAAWRGAALALLVLHVGFTLVPTPLRDLRATLRTNAAIWRDGRAPVGDPLVTQVARWVQLETEVGEPVLFLPNNGAYYYLADRPSPIRFVMGHQIVTQAHRDEVLAQLRADPPRTFVWDEAAFRVDGLSDSQVFGQPLLDWLEANYAEVKRLGAVSIRRHRDTLDAGT